MSSTGNAAPLRVIRTPSCFFTTTRQIQGRNRSDSITASLTKVFAESMTNEFVFGYTFIGFPNVFQDPSKVDRTKVGYSYQGLFKNGVVQIPNLGGAGEAATLSSSQGGFEVGVLAGAELPAIVDRQRNRRGTRWPRGRELCEFNFADGRSKAGFPAHVECRNNTSIVGGAGIELARAHEP